MAMAFMSQTHSFQIPYCLPSLRTHMGHNSQNAHIHNTHLLTVDPGRRSLKNNLVLVSGRSKKLNSITQQMSIGNKLHSQHAEKLRQVRDGLRVLRRDPVEGLVLVDSLQRLGIDYHFEPEIQTFLNELHAQRGVQVDQEQDLYQVALRFRLLRQEGHYVSADVFRRFLDKDVMFTPDLRSDLKGWISLYEASQLCMEGEDILMQAEGLSRHLLAKLSTCCNHYEAKIIGETLGHPHHKNLARFRIKSCIKDFESNNNKMRYDMKQLAKTDFSIVQLQHQKDTQIFYEWWDSKGLAKEMKLTRNRPLEWYLWSIAVIADPSRSEQRIDMAKPVSLLYTIDDIYDVYGTVEELVLFTEAVNRWDYAATEHLPGYMRECFRVLDETTNELSHKIFRTHGHHAKDSLRKSWADFCNAFLTEAKWFAKKHLPAPEEYLKNGTASSGVYVLLVHFFFLMGENMTKTSLDNLTDPCKGMSHSVATILRLWDDLSSAKDENRDGADESYVECYMNKHKSVSQESAQNHVKMMISDAWKRLNTECLFSSAYSSTFRKSVLNIARVVELMYGYESDHRLPGIHEQLSFQLHQNFSLPENLETDIITLPD